MITKMSNPKSGVTVRNGLNLILLFLINLLFLQCSENPVTAPTPSFELTSAEKSLIESDNNFGLKLFKKINQTEKEKNVFISPMSISMALGMTYNGANGSTQEAMQQTLELSGLSIEEINDSYKHLIALLTQLDPMVQFQIANSIWYRDDWHLPEAEFLNRCDEYFNALVTALNFSDPKAASVINAWVDESTNGRIKEIVRAPIDPLTVMFLINAIYFKGTWTYRFDEDLTQEDQFIRPDGSETPCKMMAHSALHRYYCNERFQAVDLSYGDGAFSMTIFLPNLQTDLDAFITAFDQDNVQHWLSHFSIDSVDVYLPRFTLEYELGLNDILTALGMGIAFSPEAADFSNMYKGGQVFISEVRHKTFVQVNEEGTEAAAVTSVVAGTTSGDDTFPPVFYANHPFVFMIRENESETILFIGKIVDPPQE